MLWIYIYTHTHIYTHTYICVCAHTHTLSESYKKCLWLLVKLVGNTTGTCQHLVESSDVTVAKPLSRQLSLGEVTHSSAYRVLSLLVLTSVQARPAGVVLVFITYLLLRLKQLIQPLWAPVSSRVEWGSSCPLSWCRIIASERCFVKCYTIRRWFVLTIRFCQIRCGH